MEFPVADKVDLENSYIVKESALQLFEEIKNLDEEEQLIVLWRSIDGLSFKTIGEMLNKSENWARVTFFRTKKKLRRKSYEFRE